MRVVRRRPITIASGSNRLATCKIVSLGGPTSTTNSGGMANLAGFDTNASSRRRRSAQATLQPLQPL
jgi:hypothetical protein